MSNGRPGPKVSVVTITYNHEAYLRQTLDNFIAQQVDFPVEFIVADDASTDATPRIVAEYADRYPDLIRPILRDQNLGVFANLVSALGAASGEYLALCEGDDYWTDPLKLSKQVEHLDAHPQDAVCFHPVRVTWEDARAEDTEFPRPSWRDDLSVDALLETNFIQTNSVMYRRLDRYDDIPEGVMPLDWYLHVLHATRGTIAMLPDTMSVYRRHAEGFWTQSAETAGAFWARFGPTHAALAEAMLDLFPDDPARQSRVGKLAARTFAELAATADPDGASPLLDTIVHRPRVAALALEHERSRISGLDAELADVRSHARGIEGRLSESARRIGDQETRIQGQESRIQEQDSRIQEQESRIQEQDSRIHEQVSRIQKQTKQIAKIAPLRAKLEERNSELRALRARRPRARLGRLLRRLGLRPRR